MKKRETAKSLETRNRIIKTAEHLFEEIGVEATTQRKVAEVAGMQVSNVYYYFSSKRVLHRAIIMDRIERVIARQDELISEARERSKDGKLSVADILFAYAAPRLFEMANTPGRLLAALFSYVETGHSEDVDEIHEMGLRQTNKFEEILKSALPELSPIEIKVRLALLDATLHGFVRILRHARDAFPKNIPNETYKEMIMNYFLNGFSASKTI